MILMPKSLIMPGCYLTSPAKPRGILKLKDLAKFLDPWHKFDKHAKKIFQFLKIKCLFLNIDIEFLF